MVDSPDRATTAPWAWRGWKPVVAALTKNAAATQQWGISMSGLDALQSVQFATVKGKRVAVVDGDDWEAMIEWLETVEDIQAARQAFAALTTAGGDRAKTGWLKWADVEEPLD